MQSFSYHYVLVSQIPITRGNTFTSIPAKASMVKAQPVRTVIEPRSVASKFVAAKITRRNKIMSWPIMTNTGAMRQVMWHLKFQLSHVMVILAKWGC